MKSHKMILLFLILILILSFVSYEVKVPKDITYDTNNDTNNESEIKTYTNKDLGISFDYPAKYVNYVGDPLGRDSPPKEVLATKIIEMLVNVSPNKGGVIVIYINPRRNIDEMFPGDEVSSFYLNKTSLVSIRLVRYNLSNDEYLVSKKVFNSITQSFKSN